MSNYYTGVSFSFGCRAKDANLIKEAVEEFDLFQLSDCTPAFKFTNKFARKLAKDFPDSNTFEVECDYDAAGGVLSIYGTEGPFLDAIARLCQLYLQSVKSDSFIEFEYSLWSDKAEDGAFGGGAVFITRKKIRYVRPGVITNRWATKHLQKYQKGAA